MTECPDHPGKDIRFCGECLVTLIMEAKADTYREIIDYLKRKQLNYGKINAIQSSIKYLDKKLKGVI
jgi:hypothetical protein